MRKFRVIFNDLSKFGYSIDPSKGQTEDSIFALIQKHSVNHDGFAHLADENGVIVINRDTGKPMNFMVEVKPNMPNYTAVKKDIVPQDQNNNNFLPQQVPQDQNNNNDVVIQMNPVVELANVKRAADELRAVVIGLFKAQYNTEDLVKGLTNGIHTHINEGNINSIVMFAEQAKNSLQYAVNTSKYVLAAANKIDALRAEHIEGAKKTLEISTLIQDTVATLTAQTLVYPNAEVKVVESKKLKALDENGKKVYEDNPIVSVDQKFDLKGEWYGRSFIAMKVSKTNLLSQIMSFTQAWSSNNPENMTALNKDLMPQVVKVKEEDNLALKDFNKKVAEGKEEIKISDLLDENGDTVDRLNEILGAKMVQTYKALTKEFGSDEQTKGKVWATVEQKYGTGQTTDGVTLFARVKEGMEHTTKAQNAEIDFQKEEKEEAKVGAKI